MRLGMSKSKNATSLYVIKSTYKDGKHSSKVVEKLGTYDDLKNRLGGEDPIEWAKRYIEELNEQEKSEKQTVVVQYSASKRINRDEQRAYNCGYLFLQRLYYELGLHKVCAQISKKYKFTFNLDAILSRLIYGRILCPSSKLSTLQFSSTLIERPQFEIQHVYRALEVIARETEYIQAELYKASLSVAKRNSEVLYFDCTNYYFEIEQEDGIKQYGYSKEHRPNPIVQMGLFMDGNGIPLAFNITKGNTNEQITMRPLEEQIMKDFALSRFVVCTDAGLASNANRRFNNAGERGYITTQSIKKLKKHLREWALEPKGWSLPDSNEKYDIDEICNDADSAERYKDRTFYKERWIYEDQLEQHLIVTFSIRQRDYQRHIRECQRERAAKLIASRPEKIQKHNANDYRRLIAKTSMTASGEVARKAVYRIDEAQITKEAAYDGFYGVCTNLENDAKTIVRVNQRRWEIEECFRIMKNEFKARPVYLSREDRITAHFTTCFLALALYRFLEKRLGERYTCTQIIQGLKDMMMCEIPGDGYVPTYTRTQFTDDLHDAFGFRTDYQIVSLARMKNICKAAKA